MPNTALSQARTLAARQYDPARYPELYEAAVSVELRCIANQEGNRRADAALYAAGGDKLKALGLVLSGAVA